MSQLSRNWHKNRFRPAKVGFRLFMSVSLISLSRCDCWWHDLRCKTLRKAHHFLSSMIVVIKQKVMSTGDGEWCSANVNKLGEGVFWWLSYRTNKWNWIKFNATVASQRHSPSTFRHSAFHFSFMSTLVLTVGENLRRVEVTFSERIWGKHLLWSVELMLDGWFFFGRRKSFQLLFHFSRRYFERKQIGASQTMVCVWRPES